VDEYVDGNFVGTRTIAVSIENSMDMNLHQT
jgi:hypothetical protein